MSFKKNKYLLFKNIITKQSATFLMGYSLLKRKVVSTMQETRYISPNETILGSFGDSQVDGTYCHYGDIAMDTLLQVLRSEIERKIKIKLVPTYSYQRIYKKGDILKRHKDRISCEISGTLNLGGDPWPIFIKKDKKEIKINLEPGDILLYHGCELEHWREPFLGDFCVQVFLHYNQESSKNPNLWDGRPHPGLPAHFKKG